MSAPPSLDPPPVVNNNNSLHSLSSTDGQCITNVYCSKTPLPRLCIPFEVSITAPDGFLSLNEGVAIVDTGASISFISQEGLKLLSSNLSFKTIDPLLVSFADSNSHHISRCINVDIVIKGRKFNCTFYVFTNLLFPFVLGLDVISEVGMCIDSYSGVWWFRDNPSMKYNFLSNKCSDFKVNHKSGSLSDVRNYRPIAKLSVLPKLFEKLLMERIYPHLSSLVTPLQHGFIKHRSVLTNLIVYEQYIIDSIESGARQVDSIYTDLAKAFDRVNHELLISKLKAYGITGSLLVWFESYLKERVMMVKLNNHVSKEFVAGSGVPQGSHLGPLLFLLFFNDVVEIFDVNVGVLLLADDLKLFYPVSVFEDAVILQDNVNRFFVWCCDNLLSLNIDKCSVISFTRSKDPVLYSYDLCGRIVNRVDTVRDLGVLFSANLHFNDHIMNTVAKAYKTLGFINRHTKDFKNQQSFKYLYCSLVRPILEFCTPVWSPSYSKYCKLIENVQNKFLRLVHYRTVGSDEYCREVVSLSLQLDSCLVRRSLYDLMLLYDILNNVIDCTSLVSSISFYVPAKQVRQSPLFHISFYRRNYSLNSPIPRIMRLFNSIASELDLFHLPRACFKKLALDILRTVNLHS